MKKVRVTIPVFVGFYRDEDGNKKVFETAETKTGSAEFRGFLKGCGLAYQDIISEGVEKTRYEISADIVLEHGKILEFEQKLDEGEIENE